MVPSANMPKRRWWQGDYFTSERGLWGKKFFAKSSSSVHAQLRKDKSKTPQREGGGGGGGRVVCTMLLHFKRGRDSFMELRYLSQVRWSCRDGEIYNHFHILFETDPQVSMRFPSIEITVGFLALALRRRRSPIRSL